jgi:ABC-type polysaccharide/polyol phosphate transport system ATPase subunit
MQAGGEVSIRVHDLGKTYKLYAKPSDRLKEVLLRRPKHLAFQSLKSVSFQVSKGESLGIIGDNGAGKSTLLKLLAGTLTPSCGDMDIHGRVAALLELGAGFHQEFTGRQNIYLNASLLGLSEAEIKAQEEAILDFAELGQFIDRPIKTYSSGMVVRLAFSIATSVDPDVLVIDEALSVGDQYFQKKSLDRMLKFREYGKTIVFCSHSMYTVNLLCNRVIWLDQGIVREQDIATEVTAHYENYLRQKEEKENTKEERREDAGCINVVTKYIEYISLNGKYGPISMDRNDNLDVEICVQSLSQDPFTIAVAIERNDGLLCHGINIALERNQYFRRKGKMRVRVSYPCLPFFHGQFSVVAFVLDGYGLYCFDKKRSAVFDINPCRDLKHELGLLDIAHEWTLLE